MKKGAIAALAALAAVALAAPAANAATAKFSGTCSITGVSTFNPPLTGTHQMIKYDFKSGPPAEGAEDGTMCSGTLNGKQVENAPVKAAVAGEGDLSCSSGESTAPGKGFLEFADGSRFPFDFTFTAVVTEVDFLAKFANTETAGHASFLHSAPPTSGFDCSPAGGGISALGFDATTEKSEVPAEGTRPDDEQKEEPGSQPGPTGGSSDPGAGEEKQPTTAQKRRACLKKANKIKNKKKRKKARKRCQKKFK